MAERLGSETAGIDDVGGRLDNTWTAHLLPGESGLHAIASLCTDYAGRHFHMCLRKLPVTCLARSATANALPAKARE